MRSIQTDTSNIDGNLPLSLAIVEKHEIYTAAFDSHLDLFLQGWGGVDPLLSEWAPLSHGMLWFLFLKMTGNLIGLASVVVTTYES